MNLGERSLVPVLTYLFRRIEKRLDGSPSLIVLDEAWLMLGHPVFRAKIREWLKVLRKANLCSRSRNAVDLGRRTLGHHRCFERVMPDEDLSPERGGA